ncbi:MAG: outer membrane lipoprotein-sorting protein [Ginsengibacter sp.]
MKNIVIFVVFILALVFVQFANGQTVDDIIDQYITARGGKDNLTSIKSIYFEGTRQMMGNEVEVKVTKVDGKLNRVDFEIGGNTGYTIITPDKGWTYLPMRSDKAEEIPADRLKNMQDQLDIAGPLIDYAAKGYKATLLGKDTINSKEAWKIQLTNGAGKDETFYIDTKTNLLIQTRQTMQGNGRNNNGPNEVITDFSDYKDVNGVMFPQTVTTEGTGMGSGSMTFEKIEINQPVDEKLYKPSN